jgi:hypothetical protein
MRRLALATLSLAFLGACARLSSQQASDAEGQGRVYSGGEVDSPLGDADCMVPNPPQGAGVRIVTLTFVLGTDGRPEPSSIAPARVGTSSMAYVDAARQRLLGCQWDPAMLDGKRVRMRMAWSARFEINP